MTNRILLALLPGALISVAVIAALAFAADAPLLAHSTRGFPYIALLAVAVIAWRLQHTRLFAAGALVLITHGILQSGQGGALGQAILAVFLPVSITLLGFAPDRGFSVARLRNHLALACAPPVLAAFFAAGRAEAALAALTTRLIDPLYTDWSSLPQLALLALLLALGALAVRVVRSGNAAEGGLFWLTLTTACALGAARASTEQGVWILASALVLLAALVEIAYSLAFHDELTGLPARRALRNTLANLRAPYAIAIVDVDHFKTFNDEHGHEVGDQVLRMVAARLRAVGGGGVAYRSGGEEFTIVFAGQSKRTALPHVEAVRDAVDHARFALRTLPRPRGKQASQGRGRGQRSHASLHVTISVGVAGSSARLTTPELVVAAADKAMYRAKNEGRNRVVA